MKYVQNLPSTAEGICSAEESGSEVLPLGLEGTCELEESMEDLHVASVKALHGLRKDRLPLWAYGGGVWKGHRFKRQTGVLIIQYSKGSPKSKSLSGSTWCFFFYEKNSSHTG